MANEKYGIAQGVENDCIVPTRDENVQPVLPKRLSVNDANLIPSVDDLLLWRISETIGSIELQHRAIDGYLLRQPDLEALPELAGDLASELFHAIDTIFPHGVQSGYRRNKIVVLTNELRASRPGQALTRSDINLRIAELR